MGDPGSVGAALTGGGSGFLSCATALVPRAGNGAVVNGAVGPFVPSFFDLPATFPPLPRPLAAFLSRALRSLITLIICPAKSP